MRDTLITAAVCCDVDNKILYAVFGSVIKRPGKISYYGVIKVVKTEKCGFIFNIKDGFILVPFFDQGCVFKLFFSCLFDQLGCIVSCNLLLDNFTCFIVENHFSLEL